MTFKQELKDLAHHQYKLEAVKSLLRNAAKNGCYSAFLEGEYNNPIVYRWLVDQNIAAERTRLGILVSWLE